MSAPSSFLTRMRYVLWGLVIIVGVAATLVYFFMPPQRPIGPFGGSFTLETTDGAPFTQNDLVGTPSLVFFGYTFCPDVCPTTLSETTAWRKALGLTEEDLRIIYVTVDPERDTAESLASYVGSFGSPILALRSDDMEQTEAAKKAFGVFSERIDDPSSTEYLINHTATIFMIGADGVFEGTIAYGEAADSAMGKIKRLVADG